VLAAALAAQAPAGTAGGGAFDDLARRAGSAREAGRLEEASDLYRKALRQRPEWAEGLWFLGTIAYERDRHAECRDTFRRFLALAPRSGPAWALQGLCQFGAAEHGPSGRSLDRALALGGLDEGTLRVVLYHRSLLRIRASEFEIAIPLVIQLVSGRPVTAEVIQACGLLLLRRPLLPGDVPEGDREIVRRSGEAYCSYLARRADEARARYERLLADYPRQEHLHYGYGLLLAQQGAAEATDQFRKETELHPEHVLAHLELAFELLKRGEAREARTSAEEATRLAPGLFAAHLALGRARVEEGNLKGGIASLETAARLGPGVRETFWALANAYARAGRTADAERARATFRKLEAAQRQRDQAAARPTTP
jgi:tetratricopeptide (TPR) repeat protein